MRLTTTLLLSVLLIVVLFLLWIMGTPSPTPIADAESREYIDRLLPCSTDGGNRVDSYTSLGAVYDTLAADIEGARCSVDAEFFKFEPDAIGQHLGALLSAKAQQGVSARLLYDDFVCRKWRWYYRHLQRQGVQTAGFGPVRLPLPRKRDYYRNHRKAIVVDNRVAYIGGINIAERYLHGVDWGTWRDTIVRIEGPAAVSVANLFAADWHYATGLLPDEHRTPPPAAPCGQLPVRIVASGPIGDGPTILNHTIALLDAARHYVWFQSPYFIPPRELEEALLRAARRGVDIRVLLPRRGDRGETTLWASRSHFARALDAGVRIALYQPGYLHSKIIVSDDRVGVVGSCNIDPRSYLLCQEVAAVVDSPEYAKALKAIFADDESQSLYIDPAAWHRRPLASKIKETLVRPLSSQL